MKGRFDFIDWRTRESGRSVENGADSFVIEGGKIRFSDHPLYSSGDHAKLAAGSPMDWDQRRLPAFGNDADVTADFQDREVYLIQLAEPVLFARTFQYIVNTDTCPPQRFGNRLPAADQDRGATVQDYRRSRGPTLHV